MPGLSSDSGDPTSSIIPISQDPQPISQDPQLISQDPKPISYPLHHGLKPPISRLSISWARGNTLRVTVLRQSQQLADSDEDSGGRVVEVKLTNNEDSEIDDSQWRRIAYGSVAPFALLQSRKNSFSALSKMSHLDNKEW